VSRIAYFDCFSGASGDMIAGALIDAGLALADLQRELGGLGLPDGAFTVTARSVQRAGFAATKFDVEVTEQPHQRSLAEVMSIIDSSGLPAHDRERITAVFTALGEAEAKVHGEPLEHVHLHEVGAVDAIVDVAAAVVGLRLLGVEEVFVSSLPLGRGQVRGRHGVLPVPAPATLELITYAMLLTVVLGVTLAVLSVVWKGGLIDAGTRIYGLAAGAIPDFWVGLLLIFFLFYMAGIVPAPFGRIDALVTAPPQVTGFYTIDSLLAGDVSAFWSSMGRLLLPVLTLTIVNAGALMKMTKTTFSDIYRSEFVRYQRACGLSERTIIRGALRNSLPPVITLVGFLFGFLLGAAVLVETIFSWGGLGQYAVQAVINSDYPALQGFVLVAAAFILIVYLVVDILYELADPRIKV